MKGAAHIFTLKIKNQEKRKENEVLFITLFLGDESVGACWRWFIPRKISKLRENKVRRRKREKEGKAERKKERKKKRKKKRERERKKELE